MYGFLILTVLGICGLISLAASFVSPFIVGAGLALFLFGIFFVWLTLEHTVASLSIVILSQILIPVYIRVPIPGIPSVPPPLMLLVAFIGILVLKEMLKPEKIEMGEYGGILTQSLLIYCGVLLFSILVGISAPTALPMWIKAALIPMLLFFSLLRTVPDEKSLQLVFDVLLIAGVANGILSIHEFFTHSNIMVDLFAPPISKDEDFFLWYLIEGNRELGDLESEPYRVFSFFTQSLELSAFMIMLLPFAMLSFVNQTRLSRRLVYGLATLIIFAGFVVTFSRGPTLALIITIIILTIFEKRLRRWVATGAFCLLVGVVLASPWIFSERLMNRLQGSDNVSLRFRLWENGFAIFQDNPIIGIGYGAYPAHHVESIRHNQIGPMYEYPWEHIERVTTLENIYITLAAETGLIGLTAFFFVLVVYFSIIRKILQTTQSTQARTLTLGSFGGVSAYLLSGLTVANILLYTITTLFFGVFLASAVILSRGIKNPGAKYGKERSPGSVRVN
ncbi:O-antigen ligase family protein [Sneathiella litorea]|uniref:O-antigen ligase-related domain-containing protein n=1 Tax=Sneathiella litorea TaxID=2606216 RepID=A0A6L8WCA0_9PROT|nr:O-antigen ligase family protein [Sneathiella litorea]MZR32394.1 hypothetical protein [Sneathiella litorea]